MDEEKNYLETTIFIRDDFNKKVMSEKNNLLEREGKTKNKKYKLKRIS